MRIDESLDMRNLARRVGATADAAPTNSNAMEESLSAPLQDISAQLQKKELDKRAEHACGGWLPSILSLHQDCGDSPEDPEC